MADFKEGFPGESTRAFRRAAARIDDIEIDRRSAGVTRKNGKDAGARQVWS